MVERIRNFFRERDGGGERPASPRLDAFKDALADDFNTPKALAELFELIGEANRGEGSSGDAVPVLAEMLGLIGLSSLTEPDQGAEADSDAQELMLARERARAEKDFERADQLRDKLAELGWTVRDSADGPRLVPR